MPKRAWPKAVGYHWDRARPVILPDLSRPCRMCKQAVTAPRRRTFCSDACVEEWKRHSDPRVFRQVVYERDKGICQLCGLDVATVDVVAINGEWLRSHRRNGPGHVVTLAILERWNHARGYCEANKIKGHVYEIDHIVPLVEGGSFFDLGNLRLLCVRCHRSETGRLAGRLAARRRAGPMDDPSL